MEAERALEIENLKARYCRVADLSAEDPARARTLFREIFMPDVVADYGYGLLHGPDAASEFLCTAIAANSSWMLHMLHSPMIDVDGDKARGEWTVMVSSKRRASGAVDTVIGRYADEFRLTQAGWRISRVAFSRLE